MVANPWFAACACAGTERLTQPVFVAAASTLYNLQLKLPSDLNDPRAGAARAFALGTAHKKSPPALPMQVVLAGMQPKGRCAYKGTIKKAKFNRNEAVAL
jgi:hypothetical protein